MFEGRSQFFSLPLLGVGTASTESLRSYIYRLAMAHHLRPKALVQNLLLRHEALRALSNLDEMFKFMNIHGDGGRANRLLDLFGESTGVDLRVATLGRFRTVLSPTHLVRRKGVLLSRLRPRGRRRNYVSTWASALGSGLRDSVSPARSATDACRRVWRSAGRPLATQQASATFFGLPQLRQHRIPVRDFFARGRERVRAVGRTAGWPHAGRLTRNSRAVHG